MSTYLADLHIHSHFSRATSKKSDIPGLFSWARVKGIHLVGTGDFTHPGWLSHLKENLVPAEPGFFRLRDENIPPAFDEVWPEPIEIRFVLTVEISSIYKRGGKVRKVHNILLVPDFEAAERINLRLAALGNIESDGRPIIGLDCRDLLEIQLEEAPEGFLVPAHIWTPWFSLFGSKSGFDSIEECFGDLSEYIFALETGLSSDPAMNRYISALDNYTLISNSDCHSPAKLGREVNLFNCPFDFSSMKEAIRDPLLGFEGTIEFFPEEGKYHLDGHRKCGVSFDPLETRAANNICPVCGRPLTVGVNHRIMDLADRKAPMYTENAPVYKSLIPLMEIISEIVGIGPGSKGVLNHYRLLINSYGSEFNILLNTPPEDLKYNLPLLDEAVKRVRNNKVIRKAGFDGQFGVITVFEKGELDKLRGQGTLFEQKMSRGKKENSLFSDTLYRKEYSQRSVVQADTVKDAGKSFQSNDHQERAVKSRSSRLLVTAGPGTGKTYTLVSRLVHLLEERKVPPEEIVAITFTNRAAGEIRERLQKSAGDKGRQVQVSTFHSFCLNRLGQEKDITVIAEKERDLILKRILPGLSGRDRRRISLKIADSLALSGSMLQKEAKDKEIIETEKRYKEELRSLGALDLEEIIPAFINNFRENKGFREKVTASVKYLLVDEFQDVNQAQYELTELIGRQAEIFVIGDPDQAIYGFRGSDVNLFFQFARNNATEVLELKTNYRSSPPILSAASELISHNRLKSGVKLIPYCSGKKPLTFYEASTPQAEAEYLVAQMERLVGGVSSYSINTGRSGNGLFGQFSCPNVPSGTVNREESYSFRDLAVLYRLNRQTGPLIEALERRGLPFQLIGTRPFFKQEDIRGGYYWLLCAAGGASRAEYISLCRETPGLGESTIEKLEEAVPVKTENFFKEAKNTDLPDRAIYILSELAARLTGFREDSETELAEKLEKTFQFLKIDPGTSNALRLKKMASALGSLNGLARHLRENSQATIYDNKAEAISLMTLHSAKGLEFPVIFMVGCHEGCIPYLLRDSELEEERRLFYVGLTRAREELYLSCSGSDQVSRFIKEIPENLLEKIEWRNKTARKKKVVKQLNLFK
ncbi:MAG: UvrD-helicase domain-containing protein [Desulfobia sp.]